MTSNRTYHVPETNTSPARHARLYELIRQGSLADEIRARHAEQSALSRVDTRLALSAARSLN